jgi:hypothetical protein
VTGVHLVVNEARVLCSDRGTSFWWEFLARRPHEVTTPSIGGSMVAVPCDDREHAEWLRDFLTARGLPASALRIQQGH